MTANTIHQFSATCSGGMESLLGAELKTLAATDITVGRNVVQFQGDLVCGYTSCLWSRFASRILLTLASFSCENEDELYQFCLGFDWTAHMDIQNSFAIGCSLGDTPINHSRFAALRVKDGLVDFFRKRTGSRPSVQTRRPDIRFHVHIDKKTAVLSLDFSGESLHRRGYRVDGGMAPLKESLAAAIVSLAGFHEDAGPDQTFLDPMCGSGTLLIEAAMIFGDSAPGLTRSYYGFTGWSAHNKTLWSKLVDEAITREEAGLDKQWPLFIGYDADPLAVASARKNIERAGLTDQIHVKQAQLHSLRKPSTNGFLVTNPPHGERLLEKNEAAQLYSFLGRRLKVEFQGWNCSVFISNPDLGEKLGINFQKRNRLFNGPISCLLLGGAIETTDTDQNFHWHVSQKGEDGEGSQFSNRLRKNLKTILKWADHEDIDCFRVYDRDLPDFNLAIDLYNKWIHVREYAPAKTIDSELAANRFRLALACIRDVLGVQRNRIFIKTTQFQRGKKHHQKRKKTTKMVEVQEGDCRFLVSLSDSVDTGLLLDQRIIRARINTLAKGGRFLNLYCSTGTATVQAATGGATSTTSVDISNNFLDWCQQNLAVNGFSHTFHETIQSDCLKWLEKTGGTYDLIFVDPPTFSKTKTDKRGFDVQRDHVRLVTLAMDHLSPDGLLIFSTTFRKLKLDPQLSRTFQIDDISRKTTPKDFKRHPTIHKCWQFRFKERKAG